MTDIDALPSWLRSYAGVHTAAYVDGPPEYLTDVRNHLNGAADVIETYRRVSGGLPPELIAKVCRRTATIEPCPPDHATDFWRGYSAGWTAAGGWVTSDLTADEIVALRAATFEVPATAESLLDRRRRKDIALMKSTGRTLDDENVCTRCGTPDIHCQCDDIEVPT